LRNRVAEAAKAANSVADLTVSTAAQLGNLRGERVRRPNAGACNLIT
jgi:hypothetical protein